MKPAGQNTRRRALRPNWGIIPLFVAMATVCLLQPASTQKPSEAQQEATPLLQEKSPAVAPESAAVAPVVTPPRTQVLYTVRRGDSLWKIARAHGLSTEALAAANGLNPDRHLHLGRQLSIPRAGTAAKFAPLGADSPRRVASQAEQITRDALAYRGVRYRYGGMSSRGFDCSGFVARVLLSQGLSMPHNAAALFQHGKLVAKANLQPGDLVFFKTRRRAGISHVGIYLGEGNFIHASSSRGRVRVDTLLTGYYARRYVGARRVASETPLSLQPSK